jgi:signal transduction histidine kinase/ligand-binding sensor domain-containing protein
LESFELGQTVALKEINEDYLGVGIAIGFRMEALLRNSPVNKRTLTLLVLALLALGSGARPRAAEMDDATSGYSVTSWTARNTLAVGRVFALAQSPDGYLWLGADTGLIRFDGSQFVQWNTVAAVSLPSHPVRALLVSRDGSLWVGFGNQGGLSRIWDGHVRNYSEKEGLEPSTISSLAEDHDGTIWVGSDRGLFRLAGERCEKVRIRIDQPSELVADVMIDRSGRLFVATSIGIFHLDAGQQGFQAVELGDSGCAFSQDQFGAIWVADRNVGFRRLGEAAPVRGSSQRGWGQRVLHDRRGNLWVGTGGQGLWRFDVAHGVLMQTRTTRSALSDGALSLLEDREGNIWVGTIEGLHKLTPNRVTSITDLGFVSGIERGLEGVWVKTADGLMWFSSSVADHGPQLLRSIRPRLIRSDQNGTLWLVTDHELMQVPAGLRSPVRLMSDDALHRITSISPDRSGGLWLYDSERGLLRWRRDHPERLTTMSGTLMGEVAASYADPVGRVWLAFTDGRVGVSNGADEFHVYGPQDGLGGGPYGTFFGTDNGEMWLGGGEGLSRFDNHRFVTLKPGSSLPAGAVSAVTQDDAAVLWIGTRLGIVRMEPSEFDRAVSRPDYQARYGLYDWGDGLAGLPSDPLQTHGNRTVARAPDGRLWFLTGRGITIVNPRAMGQARTPPPVRITEVLVDGNSWSPTAAMTFPARTNQVVIHYTLLDLTAPLNARFRYRLDGLDRDWIDAGSQRQVVYAGLPVGTYHFRVIAINKDGMSTEPSAPLDFSIAPPFYQTRSFAVAAVISIALIVWLLWREHERRVRKQFQVVLGERARLSRELHDTLLQSLVGVAWQCQAIVDDFDRSQAFEVKARLQRLRCQVEEYTREARQSITDLRSPKLRGGSLAAALRDAAEHARANHGVDVTFRVQGTPRQCSPAVEEQALRIGQEAVTNAVRHASATQVSVALEYDEQSVRVRVTDDGRGFDPEKLPVDSNGHYGLANMKERAESVGGTLRIIKTAGSGTEVEGVLPAPAQA